MAIEVENIFENILDTIDAAISSTNMTAEQAMAFLEQLHTAIDCRIDGLKDDLRNAELEPK